MTKNKRIIFFLIIILSGLNFLIWYGVFNEDREGTLSVYFFDVGQGDAIFIDAPNGNQILIDGGNGNQVLSELGQVIPFYDRSIDMIIATHPDQDHIGGLPGVLGRYEVERFVSNGDRSETGVFKSLEKIILERNISKIIVSRGVRFVLSKDIFLDILSPEENKVFKEKNEGSIVAKLSYGDKSFILTGDTPTKIEQKIVSRYGNKLKSEILKLGHHGSKTSTGERFLTAVAPEYGIISAGCGNRYGHPHKEVINRLNFYRVKILGTCEEGTLLFTTNGKDLFFKR